MPHDGQIPIQDDKTCLILDEVDCLLLDQSCKFLQLHKRSMLIGFTATATADMNETEKNFLQESYGFAITDSMMKSSLADSSDAEFCDIATYFSAEFDRMGRLVFCESDNLDYMRVMATQNAAITQVHTDCEDLATLKNIKAGQLYLVSKQALMRGFDYRCPTGIALLVAKKFDSERSMR